MVPCCGRVRPYSINGIFGPVFFSLYICSMKIKVYDAYEALYIKEAMRMEEKVTSTYDLWVEKEVTEEELLSLARRGEKIMINV